LTSGLWTYGLFRLFHLFIFIMQYITNYNEWYLWWWNCNVV